MQLGTIIAARPRSGNSDSQSVAEPAAAAPKRKTHRKSRGGCLPCKARHKRCDERRPLCTSCLVRGQECIYRTTLLASDNINQIEESQHTSGPTTLLSAASSDPFDVSSIKLPYLSSELSNHIIHYRTQIRKFFGFSQPIDISLGNPTFYQTALLIAAGHTSLARPSRRDLRETFTYHKLEIIKSVKDEIDQSPRIPGWMGCIVSGLVLANADNGEYDEAEAHLKGLFKIMDIYEGSGQLLSGWILGRVTIMPLAMIFATAWNLPYGGSNKDDSKQLPPSASHKSLWAEAAYFYELFAIEFLRDQMTGSRPKAGGEAERLDVIILKWLYNQRKNERTGQTQTQRPTNPESTAHEGGSSRPVMTVPSHLHTSRLPDEIWIARIAAAALALTVGLMHPYGVQLEDASDASRKLTTQNQDWLDDWIWVWRNSGKPMTAWPWQQILKKIAWVETEEGFEFIKTVYHEAAKEQK